MPNPQSEQPPVHGAARLPLSRSLQARFDAAFLAFLVVLVAAVTLIVHAVGGRFLVEASRRYTEQKGEAVVARLGQWIAHTEGVTQSLAALAGALPVDEALFCEAVPAVLAEHGPAGMIGGGGVWPEPGAFEAGRARRSLFWSRGAGGKLELLDDYNAPDAEDYAQASWYVPAKHLQPGACFWSQSYLDPYSHVPMTTCSAPIHRDGALWGVATVDLRLDALAGVLAREAKAVEGYLFAVDRLNRFLAFPDETRVREAGAEAPGAYLFAGQLAAKEPAFQPIAAALDAENGRALTAAAQAGRGEGALAAALEAECPEFTTAQAQLTAAALLGIEAIEEANRGACSQLTLDRDPVLGEASLVSVFVVPGAGWKLAVATPTRLAARDARTVASYVLGSLVVVLLAAMLAAFRAFRKAFVAPLLGLARRLNQTGDDAAEATLPEDRQDEFGVLARAFNARTEAIRAANEQLRAEVEERQRAEDAVRQLNEDLERRVAERTAELEASLGQLRDAQTQLVESEKMAALAGLVAGVAHEINTPVGVSVTAASHLEEKAAEAERKYGEKQLKRSDLESFLGVCRESAAILQANLKRAADLIQSFKQVAVDQSSQEKRPFVLNTYIQEVLLSLRPKLKRTSHRVLISCPPDLELESYPGALSQVLTNLIMNSLVHAFEGQPEGTMHIRASEENGQVRLEFSDDGKGMAPEHLAKVFEPFFTTKRGAGGSGLGMHIVYNLVTGTLRGKIACASSPGAGTTFTLTFPKRVEDANERCG